MPATLDITQGATDNPFSDLIPAPADELALQPKPSDFGPFTDLVHANEIAPHTAAAANELIGGGTADAPAYQKVAGVFSDVPRGVAVSTTDYGPFSDLIASDRMAPSDVTSRQFGPFDDLVPPSPAPETEKAVTETPNPQNEEIRAPTFLEKARDAIGSMLAPGETSMVKNPLGGFGEQPIVPPEVAKTALSRYLRNEMPILSELGSLAGKIVPQVGAAQTGVSTSAANQISGLTTPNNIMTLGALAMTGIPEVEFAQRAVALGFSAQATEGMFDSLAKGSTAKPGSTEWWQAVADTGFQGALATATAFHGLKRSGEAPLVQTQGVIDGTLPIGSAKTEISSPALAGENQQISGGGIRSIEQRLTPSTEEVAAEIPTSQEAPQVISQPAEIGGKTKAAGVTAAPAAALESGPFGPIFREFSNKPNEAVQYLLSVRQGEVPAALHHPATGPIDLVWGEPGKGRSDGYGLSKIEKLHPEVIDDLQGHIDPMGVVSASPNRVVLESETHRAVVSLNVHGNDKTWLLSAYGKKGDSASVERSIGVPDVSSDAPIPASRGESQIESGTGEKPVKGNTPEILPPAPEAESVPDSGKGESFHSFAEDQKLGLLPQPSEFVKQDVGKALTGVFKGAHQLKALFVPANVSEEAGLTARVIRENAAELARKKEMASASLKTAAQILRKNDPATNLGIIDKLETGKPLGSPGLDAYKAARKAGYDERIKQVQAVNPDALQHLIEDYFPHLWTRESIDRVAGNLQGIPNDNPWARIFGKRPLEGSKSFLKQRTIPTTAEGIAIGLEPVTTNPVMLDLLKMHEMDRYVMGQKIMGEMKERGLAKFFSASDKPEAGWTKINDRIAQVNAPRDWKVVNEAGETMPGRTTLGHYYAPDDAARVINNYLSPGLRGFAPYDAFRFVGNVMNQVQLGFSLYHATFTTIDAATSTVALGLEQLARSGGSPLELVRGAANVARGFAEAPVGGALIENLWRGNKFLREYSRPGTTNAELGQIVDAAIAGGARVHMDTMYQTGAIKSFFDALRTGNYLGATLRSPFALTEMISKPLMEYTVPRMKLGIISQNLAYELRKLPKEATRDDIRKIAARVVDSVDNRMGQMIYDNLFWNKALKDGLMASVRSVGWNLGDIREIGGGMLDTITAPKRGYDKLTKGSAIADNPLVTKRMAYAVALPLLVGALGSMYQYLMTGEGPKDLRDVYMPRTGRIGPDGEPERVMLPTYMKDIAPLAIAAGEGGAVGLVRRTYRMALNKLHPALTTIGQMLENQDYYGNQIRNENDGLVDTVKKEAFFVAKNFQPFAVQGVAQRAGGPKEKAQAVIGLMPAPRELTDTPAMKLIRDINKANRPAGGYTAEQQAKRDVRHAATQGRDLRHLMFKNLAIADRKRVLAVATPSERGIFLAADTKNKPTQRKRVLHHF